MNNFKDFKIPPKDKAFVGDKIKFKKLLNVQIDVLAFKVEPSKQKPGTELLTIQFVRTGSQEKQISWTGSDTLIDQIRRVPTDGFPFTTVVSGDNDRYEFT